MTDPPPLSLPLAAPPAPPHNTPQNKNKPKKKKRDQVDRKAPVYPGVSSDQALAYLDGQTLPGDFGFDPLGLLDPVGSGGFVTPQWLAYSEVIHGRWAMLGAAGCLAPEALAAAGVTPASTGVAWFRSGVIPPVGADYTYWTDPYSLFLIEIVAMQFAELKRLQDFRFPGSQVSRRFFFSLSFWAAAGARVCSCSSPPHPTHHAHPPFRLPSHPTPHPRTQCTQQPNRANKTKRQQQHRPSSPSPASRAFSPAAATRPTRAAPSSTLRAWARTRPRR
jgi:hypothetical protein